MDGTDQLIDRPAIAEPTPAPPVWVAWTMLGIGVVAASVSAILIRYASDAHPLAISFWRCAAGSALLAPFARRRLGGMTHRDGLLSGAAGIFLALHFATWITSVGMTSVAASVLLVSTTPVFTALAAWLLFSQRLPARGWGGIGVALAGMALVVAGGPRSGQFSMAGNLLALAGAATAAGYLMAGEEARKRLGILSYSVVTYAIAAGVLLVAALAAGVDLVGYDRTTWLAIGGIVVGPQLLGHTLINFSLKEIDATTVAVLMLAEPLLAAALAYLLFTEVPTPLVYPGGLAILAGIYLVTRVRRPAPVVVE